MEGGGAGRTKGARCVPLVAPITKVRRAHAIIADIAKFSLNGFIAVSSVLHIKTHTAKISVLSELIFPFM